MNDSSHTDEPKRVDFEDDNSWREYRRLILEQLREARSDIKSLRNEIAMLRNEIAMLKVKSGIWGAAAGAIPAAVALIYILFK